MKVIQMNKKKEKSQNVSIFSKLKKSRAKIILIVCGFVAASLINFYNVATTQTVATYNVDEFEVGMISDRTIIAPRSFPSDANFPVFIEEGEKIIRKGFGITEEAITKLRKMAVSKEYIDIRLFANNELFFLLLATMWCLIFTYIPFQRKILLKELIFQVVCFLIVYFTVIYAWKTHLFGDDFSVIIVVPAALFVLIYSILYGILPSTLFSLILSLGVYNATGWNLVPFVYVLSSCIASSMIVRKIERRMDMVIVSVLLAFVNVMLIIVLCAIKSKDLTQIPVSIGGVAFNGFISGILALGFLTPIEILLNTASIFRLMDLSDLNTPFLRRMLITAPGTYQHSLMVSQLAESACREIGANFLVARVGGYYHDIGKMDQPEYFAENQYDGVNKHDELAPNLSVSVIRAHVRHGVEKARHLHLPSQIVDIIDQHHGNGVITWFYEKARKDDPNTNINDYTYYGNPPSSKEAAVVMLADTVESACRTLENPTEERLDKFILTLINGKAQAKQLDYCDLTFHDITKIRECFVQVLVGYYHSRIKYPDQKDPDAKQDAASEDSNGTDSTDEKKLKSSKNSKEIVLGDKTLDEVKKNV